MKMLSARKVTFAIIALLLLCFAKPVSSYASNSQTLHHYLVENRSRYEAYQYANPDMPFDIVVALVNANVDLGVYNHIQSVRNPSATNVLVNKNFALPSDYIPPDLVISNNGRQIRAKTAEQFELMQTAARAEGHDIFIWSGYRSYPSQVGSYNSFLDRGVEWADRRSARPGHSEHQTGLTIDVSHRYDLAGGQNADGFSLTPAFRWMTENAHYYGFILRYQQGLIDIHGYIYEPWHWRYVGVRIATAMRNEDIKTLEEYYGRYLAPEVRRKLLAERLIDSVFFANHVPM